MSTADHRWSYGALVMDPLCVAFFFVMAAYYVVLEGAFGRTLGKWAAGIRVVDGEGRAPGFRRSLIRNALRMVDGLPALNLIGIVLVMTSPERARFGDRVAGTRVVHERGRPAAAGPCR